MASKACRLTIHSSRTRFVASRLRPPSRAGRLNSGVSAHMKIIQRRQKLDGTWLVLAVAAIAWVLVSLHYNEIYVPGKYQPGHLYRLSEDSYGYWFAVKLAAAMFIFCVVASFVHSPSLEAWNRRQELQMREEWSRPSKRSILWKIAVYGLLPLGLVVGLFTLAIYTSAL